MNKENNARGEAPRQDLSSGVVPIIGAPNSKSDNVNKLVIGNFFAQRAFGNEFHVADGRFFDGKVFHPLFNALVYTGDELRIGGRKFVREKGDEFWIVRFTKEGFKFDRLVQSDAPVQGSNVRAQPRAAAMVDWSAPLPARRFGAHC